MSAIDSNTCICMQKLGDDIFAKHVAGASLGECKSLHVDLWVRPHQICKRPLVWNFLDSFNLVIDFTDVLERWGQARMHAKDSLVDNSSDRQEVKQVSKLLPHGLRAVLALAFSKETIYLCCLSGLMISSQQGEPFRVAQL